MAYNIFWEKNGIYIHHSGVVTYEEIYEVEGQLVGDERYDTSQYEIIDLLEVEVFDVSPRQMSIIGSLEKAATRYRKEKQIVIVSTNKDFLPSLNNYIERVLTTDWETALVESIAEANALLKEKGFERGEG